MNSATGLQDREDLAFFGKVSASISHELKNILAIISETAGLLDDLTQMAKRGKDIDLETFKTCSKDIIEEIQRGFAVIKHMNRFSHSVDEFVKSVDLVEILDLTIGLAGFLSFAGNVQFDHQEEGPVVFTCPFRLQNLIYQGLVFAFECAGPDGEVRVSIHPGQKGVVGMRFSGFRIPEVRAFPSDKTERIAETIGAQVQVSNDCRAFEILLPVEAGTGV